MQSRAICPRSPHAGTAMSRAEKIALYKKQRRVEAEQKRRVKELEKSKLEEWYSECKNETCTKTKSPSKFEKQGVQQHENDNLGARVMLLEEKLSGWSASQKFSTKESESQKSLEIREPEHRDSENIRSIENRVQRLEKLSLEILTEISGKNEELLRHLSAIEKKIDSRNDFFERRVFDLEANCRLQKKKQQKKRLGLTHDLNTDDLSMVTSMLSLRKLTNGSSFNIQKYPSIYKKKTRSTHKNETKLNSANKNGSSLHQSGSVIKNDERLLVFFG